MTLQHEERSPSFIERLGMHPELAIGYLGLLLFMVGTGWRRNFSPLLRDHHFSTPGDRACLYRIRSERSDRVLAERSPIGYFWSTKSDVGRIDDLGRIRDTVFADRDRACKLPSHSGELRAAWVRLPLFAYGFLVWITAVTPQRYLGTAVGWFWSARTGGLPHWVRCWPALPCHGWGNTKPYGFQ